MNDGHAGLSSKTSRPAAGPSAGSLPQSTGLPGSQSQSTGLMTVVITVHRRMPYFSLFLHAINRLTTIPREDLYIPMIQALQQRSKAIRLVLKLPRQTTIEQLKNQLVTALNHDETVQAQGVINPLRAAHLTVIDLHHDEKYRIRKILENREVIADVSDDGGDDVSLVCMEDNKDVGFISKLNGKQLVERVMMMKKTSSSGIPLEEEKKLLEMLVGNEGYLDDVVFGQFCGDKTTKIMPGLLLSLLNSSGYIFDLGGSRERRWNTAGTTTKANNQSALDNESSLFPTKLNEFQLYDRLDALDSKGNWYSGCILEILEVSNPVDFLKQFPRSKSLKGVTSKETKKSPLKNLLNRSSSSSNPAINPSNEQIQRNSPPNPADCFVIRVHFDNFSAIWDEFYSQNDLSLGNLAPLYSKSARKPKIFDIQLIQRKLTYYASRPGNNEAFQLGKMELCEKSPYLLQIESYRSVKHLFECVLEQVVLRFVPGNQLDRLVKQLDQVLLDQVLLDQEMKQMKEEGGEEGLKEEELSLKKLMAALPCKIRYIHFNPLLFLTLLHH